MFCPKCKSEYVEGISTCKECEEQLVEKLEEESEIIESQELVTIMRTFDRGIIAIAKSILLSENIPFYVSEEMTFGIITFGTLNPMGIQVPEQFEETARDLLSDLLSSN